MRNVQANTRNFAFDLQTLGKAMTNGYLKIAASGSSNAV